MPLSVSGGDPPTMTRGVMVVGMHRSGTSAVTRAANLLGVPLGRADDLYSAEDNPSGHWESRQLRDLDNVTLHVFGGFDTAMPPMPRSWPQSRRATHLRRVMLLRRLPYRASHGGRGRHYGPDAPGSEPESTRRTACGTSAGVPLSADVYLAVCYASTSLTGCLL